MEDRVLFFGSGDFPIPTLEILIKNNVNIVGVITSNDSVYFNRYKISDVAIKNNIPLYIPDNVNDDETYNWVKEKNADIFCVISYKFLPSRLFKLAKVTAFNVHASMLPLLRGSAPIHWAIRNGFKETGLTSFCIDEGLDTGKIIFSEKEVIDDTDTYGSLFYRLTNKCKYLTLKTLDRIKKPYFKETLNEQSNCGIKNYLFNAPKLTKEDKCCPILYNNAKEVYNTIRSLSPNYGFFATIIVYDKENKKEIENIPIKIISATLSKEIPKNIVIMNSFGNTITDGKTYMAIEFSDCYLYLDELQKNGKKRMKISEFLCGFRNGRNRNNMIDILA